MTPLQIVQLNVRIVCELCSENLNAKEWPSLWDLSRHMEQRHPAVYDRMRAEPWVSR